MRQLPRSAAWLLRRCRPDRFTLLLMAIVLLGVALILARQINYGVGLWGDWVTYISVARNLLAGEWFVQIHGDPYLHWPPLYPMLLAAASFGVFDPYAVAGPLNAAIFGLTIFVAGQGLRRYVQRRLLVVGACLAIMLALPLTAVAASVMAGAPFILFVTISLVLTAKYLDTSKRSTLVWAAVFASLAIMTRYIGVTVTMTVLPLLLLQRGVTSGEKARRIGLYLLITALPVALWLLQNFLLYGKLHGTRRPSPWSLMEILDKYFSDMAEWVFLYLPSGNVNSPAAILTGIVLLTLAIAVGYTFVRAHRPNGGKDGWGPFYLFGGFALVYLVFLTASQSQTEILPLGSRYLAPAYIPLLFATVFALDKSLDYEQGRRSLGTFCGLPIIRILVRGGGGADRGWTLGLLPLAVALLFSLWLAGGAALNAREIRRANEVGITGLNGPRWRNSEVLQYVRELPADSLVFSDNSRAIYIYTGHPGNRKLLRERRRAMRQMENVEEGAYVVKWLYSHIYSRHYNYGITELLGLETVAKLSDGLIFRVNRAYDRAGALREEYRAITSGEPAIHSNFDVYLVENTLRFVKVPCARGDTEAKFFLHLIPADEGDLPERRKQYGFDNLDFGFNQHGLTFDGKCLATVSLPEYAISAIRTGQYVRVEGGFNPIWEGEFRLER